MRKIVILEFVSMDGVIQAPGGSKEDAAEGFDLGGWTAPLDDEVSGEEMMKQIDMPLDLLLGRKTYDIFAGYWPKHVEDVPVVGPRSEEATKYVVSHNDIDLPWSNSVLIKDDVVEQLKALKNEDGPMLQVYGSSNLAQTLLENDLVDELWLKIYPVTLGKGKKLFQDGTTAAAFKLMDSKVTPTGVIFASYERNGDVQFGEQGVQ